MSMKDMTNLRKYLIVILIVSSLMMSLISIVDSKSTQNGTTDYIEHDSIRIDGNSDFPLYTSTGNGTKSNPWIIENYNISDEDSYIGVYIGNTTDYYMLRNCLVSNLSFSLFEHMNCIYIYNSTNGKIINNKLKDHNNGVVVEDSKGINVKDNNISNMEGSGIIFVGSTNSYARNNYVYDMNTGIRFTDGAKYCHALKNGIENCTYGLVFGSDNNFAEENNIIYIDIGMLVDRTSYHIIKNNVVSAMTEITERVSESKGISLQGNYILIDNNYINNTDIALESQGEGNDIKSNIISNNSIGIQIVDSEETSVRGNTVSNNTNYGIYILRSYRTSIYGNLIRDNMDEGEGEAVGLNLYTYGTNVAYYNNFINNEVHAECWSNGNDWNAPYPTGGNYWDTYEGYDNKSGIYVLGEIIYGQQINGSDGFGDTAFASGGGEVPIYDYYPHMERIDLFPEEEKSEPEPEPEPEEETSGFSNLLQTILFVLVMMVVIVGFSMIFSSMKGGGGNSYD